VFPGEVEQLPMQALGQRKLVHAYSP